MHKVMAKLMRHSKTLSVVMVIYVYRHVKSVAIYAFNLTGNFRM